MGLEGLADLLSQTIQPLLIPQWQKQPNRSYVSTQLHNQQAIQFSSK